MPSPAVVKTDDVDLRTFLVDLATDIAEELVDDRNNVTVTFNDSKTTLLITIKAVNGELGKIIGKKGQTIGALRHLLRTIAYKEKVRITLETTDGVRR